MKIETKQFQFGNEKEGRWPPREGTYDTTPMYWDAETQSMKSGYPPQRKKNAEAPYVISDSMEPYRHPKALITVDSKSKLRDIDNVCGTITTDKLQPPDPSWRKEQERARREDHHKALHKSVAQLEAGTAPLTEETRAMCEARNEQISSALNFDAFNVIGRKKNAKGKRYRR